MTPHIVYTWIVSTLAGLVALAAMLFVFSSLGVFIDWLMSYDTMKKIGKFAYTALVVVVLALFGSLSSIAAHRVMYTSNNTPTFEHAPGPTPAPTPAPSASAP